MPPTPTPLPAQTLEEQLRSAYATLDDLKAIEVRLRTALDEALIALKGEPTE
jgi:hypothetical protein